MSKDGATKQSLLAELRQEKEMLSKQVKRLIRAEGLLYGYQEELDAQLREYKDLYDFSKKILTATEIASILEAAVQYATEKLQFERAIFYWACEATGSYEVRAVEGFYHEEEREAVWARVLAADDPLLAALRSEEGILLCREPCPDVLQDCRTFLQMQEFLVFAVGPSDPPVAILAVGNTGADASCYRSVSADPGVGNFVSLISSQLENMVLQVKMKQALEQEKLAERKYRDIFEHSVDGIFRRTPEGAYLDANPALARMLGYDSPNELIAEVKQIRDLYVQAKRHDELAAQLEKTGSITAFEVQMYRKDKHVIWVSLSARAARDALGNIRFYEGIIEDISERKRNEEALRDSEQKYRQLTETLERRVEQAVEELRKKDRMLIMQSRLALMGELINNIAHQWRQPLNMLALLVQEIPAYFQRGKCDEEYLRCTSRKEMEIIDYMSRTIDDFRQFFKPEKEKSSFCVLENVRHTLSLLEGMLKAGGIEVALHGEASLRVFGYPNQFSQVMINLLNNARDAFERGNGGARRIDITCAREDEKVVVRVSDNAGGIPDAIIDKVFLPYFTTKGPEQGTGIGLFMAKTIVEKYMQGTLGVRNVKDGAEFVISL